MAARATPPPGRRSSIPVSPPPRPASAARPARPAHPVARRTSVRTPDDHEKEQLLLQLQNKDQAIATLATENDALAVSLHAAEARLNDLYADQGRIEDEMAARIEVADKLRAQVRELEKEKRDLHRRYNEQTSTFDAERQAFYDNEQHLKSRIQSLSQARKHDHILHDIVPDIVPEQPHSPTEPSPPPPPVRPLHDPDDEPAEMTALRLELSTLSTSYSSLQSTLVLLQTQLVDLKRVNNQLQEDNESYMILLREKTLSGQFDLMKQVGGTPSSTSIPEEDDADDNDVGSLRSHTRSTLDRVDEEGPEDAHADPQQPDPSRRHLPRHARRATHSPPRGESLADLPITGPGLDLAAELGRAENRDTLLGESIDDRSVLNARSRKKKSSVDARKMSTLESHDQLSSSNDIEALRIEVKSLRDANKALSLYASKIIDRIIAEEGFEHVLAVDYEKPPKTTPATRDAETASKKRPQSAIFGRLPSNPAPPAPVELSPGATSPPNPSSSKAQRRSMSFDWKAFNMFGSAAAAPEKKADSLRPLTLKPGTPPVTGGRKLDTFEDEEDIRERERLHATMKLMGIDMPAHSPASSVSSPAPQIQRSVSSPASPPPTAVPSRRFSIFRSRSTTGHPETSSMDAAAAIPNPAGYGLGISGNGTAELTQEALEQAEAENTLAALDAHERNLSDEIAKGGTGGFTEIAPKRSLGEEWRSKRSKRSAGGSGSTVWSAGMSRAGDDPEA